MPVFQGTVKISLSENELIADKGEGKKEKGLSGKLKRKRVEGGLWKLMITTLFLMIVRITLIIYVRKVPDC